MNSAVVEKVEPRETNADAPIFDLYELTGYGYGVSDGICLTFGKDILTPEWYNYPIKALIISEELEKRNLNGINLNITYCSLETITPEKMDSFDDYDKVLIDSRIHVVNRYFYETFILPALKGNNILRNKLSKQKRDYVIFNSEKNEVTVSGIKDNDREEITNRDIVDMFAPLKWDGLNIGQKIFTIRKEKISGEKGISTRTYVDAMFFAYLDDIYADNKSSGCNIKLREDLIVSKTFENKCYSEKVMVFACEYNNPKRVIRMEVPELIHNIVEKTGIHALIERILKCAEHYFTNNYIQHKSDTMTKATKIKRFKDTLEIDGTDELYFKNKLVSNETSAKRKEIRRLILEALDKENGGLLYKEDILEEVFGTKYDDIHRGQKDKGYPESHWAGYKIIDERIRRINKAAGKTLIIHHKRIGYAMRANLEETM